MDHHFENNFARGSNDNSYLDNMSIIMPLALAFFLSTSFQALLKEIPLPNKVQIGSEIEPLLSEKDISNAKKMRFLLTMQDFVSVQSNFAHNCKLLIEGMIVIAENEKNDVLRENYKQCLAMIEKKEGSLVNNFRRNLFKDLDQTNSFETFTNGLMNILSSDEFKSQLSSLLQNYFQNGNPK